LRDIEVSRVTALAGKHVLGNAMRGGAVAVVLLGLLFAAAEIGLRARNWGAAPVRRDYPEGYAARDPTGYAKPAPGRWHGTSLDAATGELLYDVDYTIDPFGKRVTPVSGRGPRERFAMFFGCSFAYGEGVEDDETLAHDVGELAANYRPYNYAFSGSGPFEALARLDTVDFDAEVAEKSGVGLYVFMNDHVNRVNNTASVAVWHSNEVHYARVADGSFVRDGTFASAEPVRTWLVRLAYGSRALRYLVLKLPPTSAQLDLTAAALADLVRRFRDRFPGSELYVILYPGTRRWAELESRFGAHGVRTLDYHALFNPAERRYQLGPDGHPTAEADRVLAAGIVRDLHLDAAPGAPSAAGVRAETFAGR
jgi:hypothetical protein